MNWHKAIIDHKQYMHAMESSLSYSIGSDSQNQKTGIKPIKGHILIFNASIECSQIFTKIFQKSLCHRNLPVTLSLPVFYLRNCSLDLAIPLPLPHEWWKYRTTPSCLVPTSFSPTPRSTDWEVSLNMLSFQIASLKNIIRKQKVHIQFCGSCESVELICIGGNLGKGDWYTSTLWSCSAYVNLTKEKSKYTSMKVLCMDAKAASCTVIKNRR